MEIKSIAIDDEPLALQKICEFAKRIPYLKLTKCFENSSEALAYIKKNHVELIFLDIQMDYLNGLEFMDCLKDKPPIILTTAFDKYAIQAFDYEVVDFLLKPFPFSRFLKATEKVYSLLFETENRINDPIKVNKPSDYIFVKSGFSTVKIEFSTVLFIEGMKDYLSIHTSNSKVMTLLSFESILDSLPKKEFIRIHRSFIIAIERINKIENNHVIIGNSKIPIGGSFKKNFFSEIEKLKIN